jgi:asparagine synthase (glutamine-hydrolysing)
MFAFASMPKGLHALPEIPYAPDEERIAEFLALMPEYGSKSFFQGIELVEPGQIVTVTPAGIRM